MGGQDEPVDVLTSNFVDLDVDSILDPLRVKETPSEADISGNARLRLSGNIQFLLSL